VNLGKIYPGRNSKKIYSAFRKGGDIRKHFLQSLLKTLDEGGIKDSLAQHICREPLRYLESLSPEDRDRAEEYLKSMGNPDGDLNNLIRLLQENNPAVK
jgi:hypothetical protein